MCTPAVMYTLIGQESYQRLYACKNIREARKCAVISSIIAFTISLAPCIIGFAGRIDFPGLAESGESNMILGKMALEYLPGMAGGIFLCACLAAILSTADSNLSAAASHFMNDIYLPLGGAVTEKRKLLISRLATAVMGFGAVFVSFNIENIVTAMLASYTIYVSGAFIPIVVGALWEGANKTGAAWGLILGFAVYVAELMGVDYGNIPGEMISAAAGLAATVIVSLATNKKNRGRK